MADVPISIKNNLVWVQGCTVTQGSRLFAKFKAQRGAWAVARAREPAHESPRARHGVPHSGFAGPTYGVSVLGMLARNVQGCARLYDQLVGFADSDAAASPMGVALHAPGSRLTDPPRALRIAWSAQLRCGYAIDSDLLAGVALSVQPLRAAGWQVAVADARWPADNHEYPLAALQHASFFVSYGNRLATQRADFDPAFAAAALPRRPGPGRWRTSLNALGPVIATK